MGTLLQSGQVNLAQFLSTILENHQKKSTNSVLAIHRQSILWTLRIKFHPLESRMTPYSRVRPVKMQELPKLQRQGMDRAVKRQNRPLLNRWTRSRLRQRCSQRKRSRKIWKNYKIVKRQLTRPPPCKPQPAKLLRWTHAPVWRSRVERRNPTSSTGSLEVKPRGLVKRKVGSHQWLRTRKSRWLSLSRRKCKHSNTKSKIWSTTSTLR